MLEPILGSLSCERVLVFILARKEGYAREIARFFDTDLDPVQKQLEKLEVGGVLVSRTAGRTRLYSFNPRYPFLKELRSLREKGIDVVLSGGASVSIYSSNRYVSLGLDLVNLYFAKRRALRETIQEIGFYEEGRHFKHPDTQFFIEFPLGPLAVGVEPVKQVNELKFSTGMLRIISPTDCVKDRLAGYYYWDDLQCLEQAVLVAQTNRMDFQEIERWSEGVGKLDEFSRIRDQLTGRDT